MLNELIHFIDKNKNWNIQDVTWLDEYENWNHKKNIIINDDKKNLSKLIYFTSWYFSNLRSTLQLFLTAKNKISVQE